MLFSPEAPELHDLALRVLQAVTWLAVFRWLQIATFGLLALASRESDQVDALSGLHRNHQEDHLADPALKRLDRWTHSLGCRLRA